MTTLFAPIRDHATGQTREATADGDGYPAAKAALEQQLLDGERLLYVRVDG